MVLFKNITINKELHKEELVYAWYLSSGGEETSLQSLFPIWRRNMDFPAGTLITKDRIVHLKISYVYTAYKFVFRQSWISLFSLSLGCSNSCYLKFRSFFQINVTQTFNSTILQFYNDCLTFLMKLTIFSDSS